MGNGDIEIPIDIISENFDNHMDENNNILFSGKYGIGKTYFLNSYFQYRNYETYFINPVNYQINHNDDIIQLIKYDILIQLINKHNLNIDNEMEKAITFDDIINFMKENKVDIGKNIVSYIPYLGKPLGETIAIIKKINGYKSTNNENVDINTFIQETKDININESDYVSYFISNKLSEGSGTEKVLVIDDLDRLDPEHIFRILNIFSSFFDKEGKNKFGFDKIIIVGDYDNIKNIFQHKYGTKVDFNGYIDKFYDNGIFYFDNRRIMNDYVETIIHKHIGHTDKVVKPFLMSFLEKAIFLKGKYKLSIREMLSDVNKRKFKIRSGNTESLQNIIQTLVFIYNNDIDYLLEVINSIKEDSDAIKTDVAIRGYDCLIKEILEEMGEFEKIKKTYDKIIEIHGYKIDFSERFIKFRDIEGKCIEDDSLYEKCLYTFLYYYLDNYCRQH